MAHTLILVIKSGDKHCIRNCRPISLLYIILKVLEKISYNILIDFVRNSVSPYTDLVLTGSFNIATASHFLNYTVLYSADISSQTNVVYLNF